MGGGNSSVTPSRRIGDDRVSNVTSSSSSRRSSEDLQPLRRTSDGDVISPVTKKTKLSEADKVVEEQAREILLLQTQLDNSKKLKALRAQIKAESVQVQDEGISDSSYQKGEMLEATVHGQQTTIIMDGMGTYSWITRSFLRKINDARRSAIIKKDGGGDYWDTVELIVSDFKRSRNESFLSSYYGRDTCEGRLLPVTMVFRVIDDAVASVKASLGIHANEWMYANSPSAAIMKLPPTQFPLLIKERSESSPNTLRRGVTMSDSVIGTSPKGVRKTEEIHYLNNMTFDGEDTTGVLKTFAKEQGLWIYSPVAGVDTTNQIMYAKSQSRDEITWTGKITDFIRACQLAQDKYAVEQNQMTDAYDIRCVTTIQAKRICAEILKMVEKSNNVELKDILTTYQRSATDAWYLNSSQGLSLNKLYVILQQTYYSKKKIAEASAKLLTSHWLKTQTAREFILDRERELESQNFEAAKQHILINLQSGLPPDDMDMIMREINNSKSQINTKTTIATWCRYLITHMGGRIGSQTF